MPRLSEEARHFVVPGGIVSTGWPAVVARGRTVGIEFDWWQDSLGQVVLGKRADGKYAATVGGVVLSIPRQVGKTWFVLAVLVILCTLNPGLRVLWTAHHNRTCTNSFRTMQGIVRRKKFAPYIDVNRDIRVANGEQEVRFRNGSIIMFGAREQGFGRGFDEIDIEVFDEAQILTEKALEDMVAATNQARHPAGALLFYMGTPPRPNDPGEAFTLKRMRAIGGESKDLLFLECSADPDAHPDDRKQWSKANFSYPTRTPLESMLRLRENVGSTESWRREGLGVWDDADAVARFIPAEPWDARRDPKAEPGPKVVFGLSVKPNRSSASVGVSDGRYVEVVDRHDGTAWIVDRLVHLTEKHDAAVAIDKRSAAGSFIPALEAAGVTVVSMSTSDVVQACGTFFDAATEGDLVHIGDPPLDAAVAGADIRPVGDAWVWSRKTSSADIEPLNAVTLARHAASVAEPAPQFFASWR